MQLGISSYAYSWAIGIPGHLPVKPLTVAGLIEKAKQLRVDCVQIADNLPLHNLSWDKLNSLADQARTSGIRVEVGSRGLTADNLEHYLKIAGIFSSPLLRMVIDTKTYEPSIEEVIEVIKSSIDLLKDTGIKLAIENHDRLKAREFERIVLETDPDRVGICLDSVNSLGAGEGIEEVVKILAPYTINLHLKEFVIKRTWHNMGFLVEGAPAGKGMLNIPWLLSGIRQYGRCESAILELWTTPEDKLDKTIEKEEQWVRESVSFLIPFFKQ